LGPFFGSEKHLAIMHSVWALGLKWLVGSSERPKDSTQAIVSNKTRENSEEEKIKIKD
jgi:hypothetical protein